MKQNMLTAVLGYALISLFIIAERLLMRDRQTRSFNAGEYDCGCIGGRLLSRAALERVRVMFEEREIFSQEHLQIGFQI